MTRKQFNGLSVSKQCKYIKEHTNNIVKIQTSKNKVPTTKTAISKVISKIKNEYTLFIQPTTKSHLLRRESDTLYYIIKDMVYLYDRLYNPEFTEEDQKQKMKIFGIETANTCFITHSTHGVGVGDHIFEIRGYYNQTGKYGSNSKWNLIPVTGTRNRGYKRYKFENSVFKDIGYQTLTRGEYNKCSQEDKNIYNKIQAWKKYVESRGAVISFEFSDDMEKRIKDIVHSMYNTAYYEQQQLFEDVQNEIIKL